MSTTIGGLVVSHLSLRADVRALSPAKPVASVDPTTRAELEALRAELEGTRTELTELREQLRVRRAQPIAAPARGAESQAEVTAPTPDDTPPPARDFGSHETADREWLELDAVEAAERGGVEGPRAPSKPPVAPESPRLTAGLSAETVARLGAQDVERWERRAAQLDAGPFDDATERLRADLAMEVQSCLERVFADDEVERGRVGDALRRELNLPYLPPR